MSITFHWPTIIVPIGTLLVLLAFFLLQAGKLQGNRPVSQLMNAIGAAAIIVSLSYQFNLAAMLLEIAWLEISMYDLARGSRKRTWPTSIHRLRSDLFVVACLALRTTPFSLDSHDDASSR